MVQLSESVYYFLIIQRRMLWEEKMYPISRWIHLRVHHQMSSRSCKTYDWNSTRNSAIWIQCTLIRKCFIQYRIWHNWLLFSGPPHPPQQWLGKWQQNRSVQYMHIKILHIRSYWDIALVSTNLQFRFANQVNRKPWEKLSTHTMEGLLWTDSHWRNKTFCHNIPVALKV